MYSTNKYFCYINRIYRSIYSGRWNVDVTKTPLSLNSRPPKHVRAAHANVHHFISRNTLPQGHTSYPLRASSCILWLMFITKVSYTDTLCKGKSYSSELTQCCMLKQRAPAFIQKCNDCRSVDSMWQSHCVTNVLPSLETASIHSWKVLKDRT